MLYLVALVVPPLALLLAGQPLQAVLNLVIVGAGLSLLILGIGIPLLGIAVVHAVAVVFNHYADLRTDRIIDAIQLFSGHDDDDEPELEALPAR